MNNPRPLSPVLRSAISSSEAGHEGGDKVAVLLTTYNGQQFLREQLDSIASQSHTNWTVYASDDGSTDKTLEILQSYRLSWGEQRLIVLPGPRLGFAKNFMSLVANQEIQANYYAFCDQDDLWFPDKLERALEALRRVAPITPSVYCSRTRLVDEGGQVIGLSPVYKRTPSFRNALVHSIAGANTMVLNEEARRLLMKVPAEAAVVSHDWLTYLLVTGCAGEVVYDPEPTLDYRQHGRNVVGSNNSLRGRLTRALRMCAGTFKTWNQQNLDTLIQFLPLLTPQSRSTLLCFKLAREERCVARVRMLMRGRIHHQTLLGNAGLLTAAVLGKM
jgi:glycosyltransferase involved in cell wall biosynthesis